MLDHPAPAAPLSTEARTERPWRSIGIDVGLTGGVAALDSDGTLSAFPLPVLEARGKTAKGKRVLDPYGVIRLFDQLHAVALLDGARVTATLEDVHAMPGQGVTGVFSFGRSLGVVETALTAARLSYTPVRPNEWKRAMRLPAAKDAAIRRADQLCPASAHLWRGPRGGPLDGLAEAALLAIYGSPK